MSAGKILPIADAAETWRHTRSLLARHRKPLIVITAANTVAAITGLAGPLVLGKLVDAIVAGGTLEVQRDDTTFTVTATVPANHVDAP